MTDRCERTDFPNGAYCIVCDEQAFIASTPTHVEYDTDFGWNSGGNRVAIIDGPVYVQWKPSAGTIGAMTGFYPWGLDRVVTNPATLAAAFYVLTAGTRMFAQAFTYGNPVGAAFGVNTTNMLRIEHYAASARFLVDGNELAVVPSYEGASRVGACLYASGDNIL